MKSIEARLADLEAKLPKEVNIILTYDNGAKSKANIIEAILSTVRGLQPEAAQKVVTLEWLGRDNGTNGMLPQLAEYLATQS